MTYQGTHHHRLVVMVDVQPAGTVDDPVESARRLLGAAGPDVISAYWSLPTCGAAGPPVAATVAARCRRSPGHAGRAHRAGDLEW